LQNHRLSRQGFTLVELSIVLVVIGLLIGGILIGQSLVSGAKINAQIKQLQQFDIATSLFKLNYKRLPGDTNKNGYVEAAYDCPQTPECLTAYYGVEPLLFFPELSQRVMLKGNYTASSTPLGSTGSGKNFPNAAIGKGGIVAMSSYQKELLYLFGTLKDDDGINANAYTFGALFVNSSGNSGTIPPESALAIDTKLDDSLPLTGNMRAFVYNYPAGPYDWGTPPFRLNSTNNACVNSSKYNTLTPASAPNLCLISIVSSAN
jgi:prepilin-type N-terminal cleavage/methylation domain-containing protein